MKRKDKIFAGILYGYLTLPIFIFVVGWLRAYWAVLFGILIIAAWYRCVMQDDVCYSKILTRSNRTKLIVAFALCCIWVYLSGIGGMCYQNSDHSIRSAVYRALVEYSWPVISEDGMRGLSYYIGFWLPAAIVGKATKFGIGYLFQAVWAVVGIYETFLLISVWRKKVSLWPLWVMIGFSGLDYVGYWLLGGAGKSFPFFMHLEWWAEDYQFTAMTTQLFCVFNQAIPAWLATMLIFMTGKNKKNLLYILGTVMLTSTFPFVGLIPIVLVYILRGFKVCKEYFREVFTFQNIVGVIVVGGISFLFLIGNVQVINTTTEKQENNVQVIEQETVVDNEGETEEIPVEQRPIDMFIRLSSLLKYGMFLFLEVGIYFVIIYSKQKNNRLLYVIIMCLCLCPLIRVGGEKDFCMRASIPALFVLMLLCIQSVDMLWKEKNKILLAVLVGVFAIGCITPFNEIHRNIYETVRLTNQRETVRYTEVSTASLFLPISNFSGNVDDSIFYEVFAKR